MNTLSEQFEQTNAREDLIRERLTLKLQEVVLRGVKNGRADRFVTEKTVKSGVELIRANVDQSRVQDRLAAVNHKLSQLALEHS